MDDSLKKISSHGTLLAYRKSECVFDMTYCFVSNFIERWYGHTAVQTQQAARSGKQKSTRRPQLYAGNITKEEKEQR